MLLKKLLLTDAAMPHHISPEEAAKAQLETALWLWFQQDNEQVPYEPSSVHTLASAVQGLLAQVARDTRQEPSAVADLIQQNEFYHVRKPQNFFKHGNYRGKSKGKGVLNIPGLTEFFLADDAVTFGRLFGYTTALLDLYLFRVLADLS